MPLLLAIVEDLAISQSDIRSWLPQLENAIRTTPSRCVCPRRSQALNAAAICSKKTVRNSVNF
jgi:hypothetical protein